MITRRSYTITLTTQQPFRVGGKSDPLSEAHNPISTVGGRVCIPGPSLKGALRGQMEVYLFDQYYDSQNKLWPQDKLSIQPCIPATQRSADEQRLVTENRFRRDSCHYPCETTGRRPKCREAHGICPVCTLLGAQGLIGFVQVPFLFTDIAYEELYSARIERSSGTVMGGTNRPYQLIPPGAVFRGVLHIVVSDSLLGWRLGEPRILKEPTKGDAWLENGAWTADEVAKRLIVDRLEAIRSIGGYKSKGFGQVEIKLEEVN